MRQMLMFAVSDMGVMEIKLPFLTMNTGMYLVRRCFGELKMSLLHHCTTQLFTITLHDLRINILDINYDACIYT